MSNLRLSLLCAAALCLGSSSVYAEDLLSAYEQAYRTDPALAEARAQLQATLQDKPAARAALLPHLGLGASVGYNTGTFSGFAGLDLSCWRRSPRSVLPSVSDACWRASTGRRRRP